ncbi:MAG: hypothetical protein KGI33_03725 [Thaumarchaeota archaeon]|nr:hypothetical protein [Nitrososphaerota archaeon]
MKFSQMPLIVFKEGHVVIGTDDEEKAYTISNIIKSNLANFQCYPSGIKVRKLIEVYYDSNFDCNFSNFSSDPCGMVKGKITEKELIEAIIESGKIYKNKELMEELLLLTDSREHLNNRDYAASFLFSWLILERKIFSDWDYKIKGLKLSNDRTSQFLNHKREWSLGRVLEISNLLGIISNEKYQTLTKFRDIRNNLAHGFLKVERDDAKKCFAIADFILSNKMSLLKSPKAERLA